MGSNPEQPTPIAHGIAGREVAALSIYYFLFFAAVAFPTPFAPLFLDSRGLSLSQIAVLSALYAAAGGLTQAPLGHLSDSLGSRRLLAAVSCLSLAASYVFYPRAYTFSAFIPLYIWSGVSFLGGYTLPQAMISDWTAATGSTARGFSATRIWGSVGFILSLLVVTRWPQIVRGTAFLYWGSALFALSVVPLLLVREAPARRTARSLLHGAASVLRSQRSWVFLVVYTLFRLCEAALLAYLGIYIRILGGDNSVVAVAYLIGAIAEVPVILLAGEISDRIGRKPLLVLACVIWAGRLYAYSLLTSAWPVYYIQLFHGFTFGIMLVASVAYMSDVAPADLRGTAQGLLSLANAVALALGPLLMGFLGDLSGLPTALRVQSMIVIVALLILVFFVREPMSERRRART